MDDPVREGLTPLAIMLRLMRERWAEGDKTGAAAMAKAAAPFVHPRANAAHDARQLWMLRDDELDGWIDETDASDIYPP